MATLDFSEAIQPVHVEMELRFGTHKERVRGMLVGQRKAEYLIVEVSKKYNWVELQDWFATAASVVIRGILDKGTIVAGVAGFLTAVNRPQRMVYLSYPDRFESRVLRHTPRVEVELDAVVRAVPHLPSPFPEDSDLTELKGSVIDLSRGGLGFETQLPENFVGDELNGSLLEIEIFDEEKSLLKTLAEVRGSKVNDNLLSMGLLVDRENANYLSSLDNLILHSKLIKNAIKG